MHLKIVVYFIINSTGNFFNVSSSQVQNANFLIQQFMAHFNRVEIHSLYTTRQRNKGSIYLNCSLENNRFFKSIVCLLCGCLSISGGIYSTSVQTVSWHLIQVGFSSENVIPLSIKKIKRRCMARKEKLHRTNALNPEAIFEFLDWIPSIQAFDSIVIVFFFVVVAIALSNMNSETWLFNTYLNGFKRTISNGWTKWVVLAEYINNTTLSHCNGYNSHHKPIQAGA